MTPCYRSFANKHRYEVDANQELVGLGLANIAAGVFSGYPVTGGFSRTAVNDQAGARSGMASIITALPARSRTPSISSSAATSRGNAQLGG